MKNKYNPLIVILFLITLLVLLGVRVFKGETPENRQMTPGEEVSEIARSMDQLDSADQDAQPTPENTTQISSEIAPGNTISQQGVQPSINQVQGPKYRSTKTPALSRLFSNATLIESRNEQNINPDYIDRLFLFKTNFKYPLIVLKQTIEQATDVIVNESASVGDHIIVQVEPTLSEDEVRDIASGFGYQIRRKMFTEDSYLIEDTNPNSYSLSNLLSALAPSKNEGIIIAEPDVIVHSTATIPNDSSFTSLWGLNNTGQSGGLPDADIDAPEAWDITTGSSDVVVAVIDSGIDYNHVDLADNMWRNPGEIPNNGVDDDGNGFVDDIFGWDFANDDADPFDDGVIGHGTHCAGTIGAVANNAEGVSGVSWNVSLMALKLFDAFGFGSISDAVDCISYSIFMDVDLSSNSWGTYSDVASLRREIRRARDNDILMVAAAGNEEYDTDVFTNYPSGYDFKNIISVAASTRTDELALFSNIGATSVDLAAPGTEILSTFPGDTYGLLDGTSMATPHVAGVCALIFSLEPNLTYEEVKERVLDTVDPLPSLNGITVTGGRLNAYDAVNSVGQPLIKVLDVTIDDDNSGGSSGNGDGIINPGETVDIAIKLKNIGSENVSNLVSSLSLDGSSNAFTILNNSVNIGNLKSGNETTISGQFLIKISNNAPTPTFGTFVVTTQNGSTPPASWQYEFDVGIFINSTIKGKVFSAEDSSPIQNAVVSYSGPVSGSVTTKANGSYTLNVLSGDYTLTVTADDFFESAPRSVTVPPNKNGINFFLEKPNLSVSPSAITTTLDIGDQDSQTITLSNPGTVPLTWDASIFQADFIDSVVSGRSVSGTSSQQPLAAQTMSGSMPLSTQSLTTINGKKIMVFFSSPFLYNDIFTFLESQGATVIEGEFPILTQDLEGVSVLIFDDSIFSPSPFDPSAGPEDIAVIREWVANGGGLFLTADNEESMPTLNAILEGTGITALTDGLEDLTTLTNIIPHPITGGVSALYMGIFEAYFQISGQAHTIVFDTFDRPNTVVSKFGSGKVVAAGDEILNDSNFSPPSGDGKLFGFQAIQWLAGADPWIDVSPSSGTVPPGATRQLTLTLDTSTLDAGVYKADIVFDWDDPNDTATSLITLPVELTALGSPEISVSSTSLDFGDVIRGSSETIDLIITNDGEDFLNIQDIVSNRNDFTVDSSTILDFAPGQSRIVPVTFSASSFGNINGVLTLQSDAGSSANFNIQLSGRGIVGPLNYFEWDVISSPKNTGVPFSVSITAKDVRGNTVTGFNSTVDLDAYTGELFTDNTVLNSPESFNAPSPGNTTQGYSFTPSEDLTVTHVRYYSGNKVSIWEDNGNLITSIEVFSSASGTFEGIWEETALPDSVLLRAGKTYRVTFYSAPSFDAYSDNSLPSTFPHGTIDTHYDSLEDTFPTNVSQNEKWLVGFRYKVLTGTPVAVSPTSSTAFSSGTWTGNVTVLEAASSVQLGAREPNSGATGFSQPFNVQGSGSNQPPTVSFNDASELDKVEGYEGIYIEADASDPDGTIDNVRLFLNGVSIRADKKAPYNWFGSKDTELVGLAAGVYEIKVVATDNEGATAEAITNLTVTAVNDNQPPTVSFNDASELDKVEGYEGIYIEADASDPDGTIDNVRLFLNGVSIRADKKAPYNWFGSKDTELVGLAAGVYEIKVVATDNEGATAEAITNLTVTAVNDSQPPTVSFNDASELDKVEGYEGIYIEADASDPDGTIDNVRLFLNGVSIRADKKAPYNWFGSKDTELVGLAAGVYEIKVVATDNEGATAEAITNLTVTALDDNQPPTVAFNAFSTLRLVEGYSSIYIEADAMDEDGTISNVRLFLNGALIGRDRSFQYIWNEISYPDTLLGLAAGTYELRLLAKDNEGATAEVFATLTVETAGSNQPPTVSFNSASELLKIEGYDGIYIEANASDADGTIDNVRLFLDGASIRSDKKAPYNWFGSRDTSLVGLPAGIYKVKAIATDDEGATAEVVTNLVVQIAELGVPVIYEAEGPEATTSESIRDDANGFSGTGFVKFNNNGNGFIEWTVEASEDLTAEISFAYALGSGDKPLKVLVNSVEVESSLSFPATGGRNTWLETVALRVSLSSGNNTIRVEDIGLGGANIDYLKVVPIIPISPTANP